jgi:hypothetical protein
LLGGIVLEFGGSVAPGLLRHGFKLIELFGRGSEPVFDFDEATFELRLHREGGRSALTFSGHLGPQLILATPAVGRLAV